MRDHDQHEWRFYECTMMMNAMNQIRQQNNEVVTDPEDDRHSFKSK